MAFTIPSELKDIVLHWWKIIDRPQIHLDELCNFIAFDLYLAPLEKTKIIVQQAIRLHYLKENTDLESVSLSKELQTEFDAWQEKGVLKAKTMAAALAQPWRPKVELTQNMTYEALESDLIDVSVKEKAGKIRASAVTLEGLDFATSIHGHVKEKDKTGSPILYPFAINIKDRTILHQCPEYDSLRKNQKRFCTHLGRVIMKLYSKDKEKTIELLHDIVNHKHKWTFS